MSLFRLNQVPDAFYTHMLNCSGFEPFPATAARTDLTFWLVDVVGEPVVVPAGTAGRARPATIGASARVHDARATCRSRQPALIAALVVRRRRHLHRRVGRPAPRRTRPSSCFPRTPTTPGDCFYLGFERSLAGNAIRLDDRRQRRGHRRDPRPSRRCAGRCGRARAGSRATVYRDTTGGLNRDGQIVLLVPPAHEPLTLGGAAGVLAAGPRARARARPADVPRVAADPPDPRRLDRRHGHRRAQRARRPREVLGRSTGQAGPGVHRARTRRCCRAIDGETDRGRRRRRRGDASGPRCRTSSAVGPDDRHFVWDSTTGEVRFGPLIRYPDGSTPPARRGAPRRAR